MCCFFYIAQLQSAFKAKCKSIGIRSHSLLIMWYNIDYTVGAALGYRERIFV